MNFPLILAYICVSAHSQPVHICKWKDRLRVMSEMNNSHRARGYRSCFHTARKVVAWSGTRKMCGVHDTLSLDEDGEVRLKRGWSNWERFKDRSEA